MNKKIYLLLLIVCVSSVWVGSTSAEPAERARILFSCTQEFGAPVDPGQNLFEVNQAFVLQVTFDRFNRLSELAIKPKYFFDEIHPEWKEPDSFPLLSWDEFEKLIKRLDTAKTRGKLTKPANTIAFVTNSTGYFREAYKNALLEWGEVGIRKQPENGIRFFSLKYNVSKRRPNTSRPHVQ